MFSPPSQRACDQSTAATERLRGLAAELRLSADVPVDALRLLRLVLRDAPRWPQSGAAFESLVACSASASGAALAIES